MVERRQAPFQSVTLTPPRKWRRHHSLSFGSLFTFSWKFPLWNKVPSFVTVIFVEKQPRLEHTFKYFDFICLTIYLKFSISKLMFVSMSLSVSKETKIVFQIVHNYKNTVWFFWTDTNENLISHKQKKISTFWKKASYSICSADYRSWRKIHNS